MKMYTKLIWTHAQLLLQTGNHKLSLCSCDCRSSLGYGNRCGFKDQQAGTQLQFCKLAGVHADGVDVGQQQLTSKPSTAHTHCPQKLCKCAAAFTQCIVALSACPCCVKSQLPVQLLLPCYYPKN